MTTFIEAAVTLADVAKVLKTTPAAVEADCRELSLYIGSAWDGRPALDVRDAALARWFGKVRHAQGSPRRVRVHCTRPGWGRRVAAR